MTGREFRTLEGGRMGTTSVVPIQLAEVLDEKELPVSDDIDVREAYGR